MDHKESSLLCSEESVSNVEPTVENGSKNCSTRLKRELLTTGFGKGKK